MSIIGPSSVTVQDEGTTVAHTNKINFTGSGVSATYDSVNHRVTVDVSGGGGGGEANTASNVGTGAGVFKQKTAVDLQFKSIRSSDGTVSITGNTDDVDITASLTQLNGFTYVGWTTYSGTINWTGTTAPSGATSHEYQYSSLGGVVNLWIRLEYANAGSALTVVQMALPSGVPTPQRPAGVGANERYIGAAGYLATANNADGAASRAIMHYNGTSDLIRIIAASGAYRVAYVHICYLA